MILKEQLKNLSIDRIKYLGIIAKQLTKEIDNILTKDKYTVFEALYILSLSLLGLLQSFSKEALGYFTNIFNEMCLVYQHKAN